MTDKWFIQDIEKQLQQRNRTVFLDPSGQCEFLLPLLDKMGVAVLRTDNALNEEWQMVKEELFLRYDAESRHKNNKVVFYVTRETAKLSFLFDYCFTHGCLDLTKPGEWLKNKLFANTGLQVQQDSKRLLLYAKLGRNKDINWWRKIIPEIDKPLNIGDELLPFLKEPDTYLQTLDPEIKEYTESIIFELLGQPYMAKPAKTLASEVANLIFDKLLNNDISGNLLEVYYKWIDSNSYRDSLKEYVSKYTIDKSLNIWGVHPDHCFDAIDIKALKEICDNIRNSTFVKDKLSILKKRAYSSKAASQVPDWWHDVITLLEFDNKPLAACNSFDKVVSFYTSGFNKADRAVRNLYLNFLQEESIIRPLQEYYENLNHELLQHWFEYSSSYRSNQQGYLVELLNSAKPGIAIIVGDGVRYEIADYIATNLEKQHKVERATMIADMPSETEHNMSALYAGSNEVIPIHKDREKKLSELTGKLITYLNLEALHYGIKADFLVLTYKDIDNTGEKLQHGAIKLFGEFEHVLYEKINLLLNMGYKEVHLVTDHGFVLTGLLDESDKIDPVVTGNKDVSERFIRTVDKQNNTEWIAFDRKYGEYNFVYTAKSPRPFKSKGVYGYSHGGFTPQEIIIPNFVFRKTQDAFKGLAVSIMNKKELIDITGEIFGIKIQAASAKGDLFSTSRKIQALLYANNINYSSSHVFTMDPGTTQSFDFSFNNNSEVQVVLVDAATQEQLDSVIVKKSNARDFGGLL